MIACRRDDFRTTSPHPRVGIPGLGLLCMLASTILGPPSAVGALTPIAYDRTVSTFAFLDTNTSPDALRSDERIESFTGGGFSENALCLLESLGSQVTAASDQSSEITVDRVVASFHSSAAIVVGSQQHSALGIASGGIIYDFSVDAATQVRLTGNVIAAGGATFDLSLYSPVEGFLLRRQWSSISESYDETIDLAPGSYQLAVGGGGDAAFSPLGISSSDLVASFDAQFTAASDAPAGLPPSPEFSLAPNPIAEGTEIFLSGSVPHGRRIAIFDPAGREVRSLTVPGGTNQGVRVTWDRRDRWNRRVPAGIYLVRVAGGPSVRAVVLR
ncbi:MAG: T9SS type A sorting domain-containing protein [Candidatus Eisenbacteria bacterium]|nr:T9SS type A sorting domain-containing protein [Candidatus Eisenbacteria bacterium]